MYIKSQTFFILVSISVFQEVTERHEAVMAQLMSGEAKNQNIPGLDSILRGEILRKDGLIRQLMDQNKMLLNTKERQEVEVAALNETLEVSTTYTFYLKFIRLWCFKGFFYQKIRTHYFLEKILENYVKINLE